MSKLTDKPMLRGVVVWLLLIAVESVHGGFRNAFLAPYLGDFRARQVAVFSGAAIILFINWLVSPWLRAPRVGAQLAIGAIWVSLTLPFEILAGRLAGSSWERIASDFDIPAGGLLPVGLLIMLFSPLIVARGRVTARRIRISPKESS